MHTKAQHIIMFITLGLAFVFKLHTSFIMVIKFKTFFLFFVFFFYVAAMGKIQEII